MRIVGKAAALALILLTGLSHGLADPRQRTLVLGREVSGSLDNGDHYEDLFSLRLNVPRGVYRVFIGNASGTSPGICFSGEALEESVCLSAMLYQRHGILVTLPVGDYSVSIENELGLRQLDYRMKIEAIGPWDESMEWEPNEEPCQQVNPGRMIEGQVLGEENDCFHFNVSGDTESAFDFRLKSDAAAPLLLMVGDGNEEEQLCRIGAERNGEYIIRGLSLNPGRYILSVSLNPTAMFALLGKGGPETMKLPVVSYSLQIERNSTPLCRLVSEEEAFFSRYSADEEGSLVVKPDPRREWEEKLHERSAAHRAALFQKPGFFRSLSRAPLQPEWRAVIMDSASAWMGALIRETTAAAVRSPVILAACQDFRKRFGELTDQQAQALAALWPEWKNIPDDWAKVMLDGPAAKLCRQMTNGSAFIVSAAILSNEGLFIAGSDIPGSFWQGDQDVWQGWRRGGGEAVSTSPVFDKPLNRWLLDTALSIREGNKVVGVIIIRSVLGE